jgi:hypothetical protein
VERDPRPLAMAILLAALFIIAATARPADCNWCVPTICGTSAECLEGCHCAKPWGETVGRCSG